MTIDTEPTRILDNTRKQLASNKKIQGSGGRNAESQQSENSSAQRVALEGNGSEVRPTSNKYLQQISLKGGVKKRTNKRTAKRIHMAVQKERREVAPSDSKSGGCPPGNMQLRSRTLNGHKDSVASSLQNYPSTGSSRRKDAPQMENNTVLEDRNDLTEATYNEHSATYGHASSRKEESVNGNICRQEDNGKSWNVIEQGLLVKGLEIFGRNRLDLSPHDLLFFSGFISLNLVLMCCIYYV
jgi:histone-lysine N-methyltransferase EZH2